MIITSEHFGKKLRRSHWLNMGYFIPLGFNQNKTLVIGETADGYGDSWDVCHEDWVLFEEPKKKVIKRLAPALIWAKSNIVIKDEWYCLSPHLYETYEEAKKYQGPYFVKWPASYNMFIDVEVEE